MDSASKTVVIENNKGALATALEFREYANITRLMSIEGDVLNAISVAYKTASGLHSTNDGQIARSIYNMSKIAIALMIVKADSSDKAFDTAAFEIARDIFVSGKIQEKAQALAEATGRTQEACHLAINSKLEFLTTWMSSKTNALTDTGFSTETPEAIRDIILADGGKYLISLPTGEGKSTLINEPVLRHFINSGKKVLVISHRCSINKTLANIPGIVSYDECDHPNVLLNAKGLKIVVNSLTSFKFKRFIAEVDFVVIDEASQVISHVLGGEVKNRQSVWETLNFVVKNTANVIMSDADIDSRCMEMIGPGHKLYKKPAAHAGITVRTGDINHVRALAIEAACKTNTLIACDTVKEALALALAIEKKGGPSALVITANSAQWPEQASWIADPNSTTHQVVIYSPVITSALSITSGHFTAHFGVFQGQVVPSDAIQMLRRDRTAQSFTVGIKQPLYSKSEAVEAWYKCKPVCLNGLLASINFKDGERAKAEGLVRAELGTLEFQFVEYKHRKDEAWLRDNIQNTLPASLLARGFCVEVLEHDGDLSLAGFKADSQARKAVKRQIANGVNQALTADQSTAKRVQEHGSVNEREYLEASRSKAIEVMKVSDFNLADAMVWAHGEGESKIRLYRKLHSYSEVFSGLCAATAIDPKSAVVANGLESPHDELLGIAGVAVGLVEHGAAKVLALIKPALILMTYSNAWTGTESIALFDNLNAIRTDVLTVGIRMSSAKSDQAKKADITKIFSQFGLIVKKHETTNKKFFYTITPKSLTQMLRYI